MKLTFFAIAQQPEEIRRGIVYAPQFEIPEAATKFLEAGTMSGRLFKITIEEVKVK